MRDRKKIIFAAFTIALFTLSLAVCAQAQTETIVHNFAGPDGAFPSDGVLLDSAANLYGTTFEGGNTSYCAPYGCGLVYRLSRVNGHWQETVLRDFPNDAGGSPGDLISDGAGNLYGVTFRGGNIASCPYDNTGCGTVFELTPTATGQWKRTLLYAFAGGADGGVPYGGLAFDSVGNLYGTAEGGGTHNQGVVFKLSPHFGSWTETVLYNFDCGKDGCDSRYPLTIDSAGNLYGTLGQSKPGFGVAFELSPTKSGHWTHTILHTFTGGNDGADPTGPLTPDSEGNLYGATYRGGGAVGCFSAGCGTVFKLSPNSTGGWTETILQSFIGIPDGDGPNAGVTFDVAGNLYGTTYQGGTANLGSVYELSPASDGTWTEKILHSFTGKPTDGSNPVNGLLVLDAAGNLYGTAAYGGAFGYGVMYEITP